MEVGTKYRILSIDEEKEVQYYLKRMFVKRGYKFDSVQSGRDGICQITNGSPDVVLLDLVLPDMDGMEIIRQVRLVSDCPMIVISSKGKERDKVLALDAGADDYLVKPFGSEELLARIRCVLRYRRKCMGGNMYQCGNLKIDFEKRMVLYSGEHIHVTPVEYRILEYLALNSGKVITYQMLLEKVWGQYAIENNKILRVNMTNIRRKIKDNPTDAKYIFTEAGVGYRMAESEC